MSLKTEYSIAGKVFILGEYAALAGHPALVATLSPRQKLLVVNPALDTFEKFHAHSPLGLLQDWAKSQGFPPLAFSFEDPIPGKGGFGASTGQFAMAYFAYAERNINIESSWRAAWQLYRELTQVETLPPSGADLVAQWQGGVVFFDPREPTCTNVWSDFDWSSLLIFSATAQAGRKVATHEHLALLSQRGFPEKDGELLKALERTLRSGFVAIQQDDAGLLAQSMNQYASILHDAGLELPQTTEDRRVLGAFPGVLSVKGAGAMQADCILVLIERQPPVGGLGSPSGDTLLWQTRRDEVIQCAKSRGLQLVSQGLNCERGVACH